VLVLTPWVGTPFYLVPVGSAQEFEFGATEGVPDTSD
jgi:hypothetical protein